MAGANVNADFWVTEYITPWDVYHHGVSRILAAQRTAFQEMLIVETGAYGKALVLDGKWQSCTGDEFLYHEPLVQPACILHGAPKRALVLGGGEGATVRELLRWKSIERVVMVDIDGEVVDACREHLEDMHQGAFDDPRLEVVVGDALDYLDQTDEPWDVLISDLSDPIEEGPSFKLFTREYFEKTRRALADDGVFVVQAGSVSPIDMDLHVRLVNTVGAVYPNVRSYASHIPSYATPWGFGLASARPLNVLPEAREVTRRLEEGTTGGLRLVDGPTFEALLTTPSYIQRAIDQETQVYTLSEPPKFFGSGVAHQA